jgi:hypothetical protein
MFTTVTAVPVTPTVVDVTPTYTIPAVQLTPNTYLVGCDLFDEHGRPVCPRCSETLNGPECCGSFADRHVYAAGRLDANPRTSPDVDDRSWAQCTPVDAR